MSTNHITPFPNVNLPVAPTLPLPPSLSHDIRTSIENTIIDVMNNPGSELGNIIKKHVKESLECKEIMDKLSKNVHLMHENHIADDEKSDLEVLFCEIVDHHKEIMKGKSIYDVEREITDKFKDLSDTEHKVLSCLLRSDGPLRLASLVGIEVKEFIDAMKNIGNRFKTHN